MPPPGDTAAQAFLEIAGVMFVMLDRSGRVAAINPKAREVLGCAEAAIVGKDWFATFVPESIGDDARRQFEALIRGDVEPHVQQESRVRAGDGSEKTIELRSALLHDPEGRVHGVILSGLDVTDRRRAHERFVESEARYRRIVETSHDGIWLVDAQARTLFVNPRLAAMMRCSESEMIGRPVFDFMDANWRAVAERHFERRRRGIKEIFEICFRRSDGSPLWALLSTAPTFDDAGNPSGGFAMVTDISQRKAAEQALVDRARQHAVVAELGQLALREGDLDDFYDAVVEKTAETLDVSHTKILKLDPEAGVLRLRAGRGWRPGQVGVATVELGVESQAGYTLRASAPVVVSDMAKEERFRPRSLLVEHGIVSGMSVVIGDANEPWGVLGAHHVEPRNFTEDDTAFLQSVANLVAMVTWRWRLEQERADITLRYRELIEQSTDGIVLMEQKGRIQMINSAAEELAGYARSEMIGRSIVDEGFLSHASRTALVEELGRLRQEKAGRPLDLEIMRPDGSTRLVESRQRAIRREETIVGVLAMLRDVTQERNLERQLHHAQRMESIGRLAGGVAHDFNNLLSVILCVANLAKQDDAVSQDTVKDLDEISATANRARRLTQQLLAFSRRQVVEPVVVDVNRQVRATEAMLRRIVGDDIAFEAVLDSGTWAVKIDPASLEQVLVNLVVNARDAMPDGGQLTIEVGNATLTAEETAGHPDRHPGDYVVLAVSDTGGGIEPQIRERIFEPFFTTKPRDSGTGLGLSTCYGIVAQAGGFIVVDSEIGRGSRFRVYLPRVERTAGEFASTRKASDSEQAGETVMVVEDASSLRSVAVRCLKEFGYHVLDAANGRKALEKLERYDGAVHAVVTDVVMPEMGGIEFARQLSERRPATKVLYTSGYADEAVHEIPMSCDGVAFLSKPYTPDQLNRTLRQLLG